MDAYWQHRLGFATLPSGTCLQCILAIWRTSYGALSRYGVWRKRAFGLLCGVYCAIWWNLGATAISMLEFYQTAQVRVLVWCRLFLSRWYTNDLGRLRLAKAVPFSAVRCAFWLHVLPTPIKVPLMVTTLYRFRFYAFSLRRPLWTHNLRFHFDDGRSQVWMAARRRGPMY